MYVKDLRVLNRNLSDMVLVDNAAYSYAFQLDNGIPIIPYYEGRNDFELKALQTYLEGMVWVKDVRETNRNTFKLAKYREHDDPDVLVKELYGEWII
jgi:CTD small phosphatase-like protein 2